MPDNIILPDFPRPDLPEAAPENYPTLRIRVLRRLGLPDDGGLYLSDAIDSDVLRGYRGEVTSDDASRIVIGFASLADAVSWADNITETGRDRDMVTFTTPPASPYQPASITIQLSG
jgi:hypothetical protein